MNSTLASQVDLGPTLFGLLKWQYHSKFFGKDILAADFTPRAYIGNYQRLGYLEGGYLAILNERQGIAQYQVASETMQDAVLVPVAENKELSGKAICFYQGASLLYQRGLDRWSGGERRPSDQPGCGQREKRGDRHGLSPRFVIMKETGF